MFYSSGTTGRPKGVRKPLTLEPAWEVPGYFPTYRDLYGFDADTVWLSSGRCTTRARSTGCLATPRAGGTAVVMERFDPRAARRHRAPPHHPRAAGADPHESGCSSSPTRSAQRYDLSSLQMVVHAAAPCPVEVKQAMLDWLGPIVHEFYAAPRAPA